MKKYLKAILCLVLALTLVFAIAGCGEDDYYDDDDEEEEDLHNEDDNDDTDEKDDEVKKELLIGYTIYEPMNYFNEEGKLIGFDTELAKIVCRELDMDAEFVEIDWSEKFELLRDGDIDCIWNGLIKTEDIAENADFTDPYYYYEAEDVEFAVAFKKGSDLTDEVNDILKKLKNKGKIDNLAKKYFDSVSNDNILRVATNSPFPPYEYKLDGELVGIDIEIAKAIAEELNAEIEFYDMEFDALFHSVKQGQTDMLIAAVTVTEERLQTVDFTSPYFKNVQVVIVPESSDITTVSDLSGKMIGAQAGTTAYIYSSDEFGSDNVFNYSTAADAISDLKSGEIDAVIMQAEQAKQLLDESADIKILDEKYSIEEYSIGISKDNTALLNEVNEILDTLKTDGTIDEIISKYIS